MEKNLEIQESIYTVNETATQRGCGRLIMLGLPTVWW